MLKKVPAGLNAYVKKQVQGHEVFPFIEEWEGERKSTLCWKQKILLQAA
jgi:hypothetical protein